jgi:hypothetical protein
MVEFKAGLVKPELRVILSKLELDPASTPGQEPAAPFTGLWKVPP